MLQLRPNCEYCDKDLPPHATDARICSYECTFCAHCAEAVLCNVCPNCGGGFVPRPIRPVTERRSGASLGRQPASTQRVHLKWDRAELPEFIAAVRAVRPEQRQSESDTGYGMQTRRIHIVGASGAGVTTLGRALADALAAPHHDTDDYYWRPTAPPYRDKRDVADRLRLMREIFLDRPDWVLSGSLDHWAGPVVPLFDLVVFVRVPTEVRLRRLRDREAQRFGRAATLPEGWRHQETEAFIEWASHYDDGAREGRNLPRHLKWLDTLTCRVIRIDGTQPIPHLVDRVVAASGSA